MDRSGLDLHGMVYGPNGEDRLCLFYEAEGEGWNFHSLVWERLVDGSWQAKVSIDRERFQGSHDRRRWVSELFSIDPQRGFAALKVAEGNRPETSFAIRFDYSWRTWDLLSNREIGKLKDCDSPFDPL